MEEQEKRKVGGVGRGEDPTMAIRPYIFLIELSTWLILFLSLSLTLYCCTVQTFIPSTTDYPSRCEFYRIFRDCDGITYAYIVVWIVSVMSSSSLPTDSLVSVKDSLAYWNSVSPTVDGMLGGYPHVSRIDLKGSANFLTKLRRHNRTQSPVNGLFVRGLDCGAGIGRVTAGLLSRFCETVDAVEPVEKFAKEIRNSEMMGNGRVEDISMVGLQEWIPTTEYDLIWNQWCVGHLTDVLFVEYLKKCAKALRSPGWIVVKENISTNSEGEDMFDDLDSTVTRTDAKYVRLFSEGGLRVVRTELQTGFPKGLFPVRMYALQPRSWTMD